MTPPSNLHSSENKDLTRAPPAPIGAKILRRFTPGLRAVIVSAVLMSVTSGVGARRLGKQPAGS